MECVECYSCDPRITPLKGARDCLENHRQYVCSKCGRIVCVDLKGERRARCFMPFGSLEAAKLYLKCAEIIARGPCGIYELIYKRGDKRYRIFRNKEELEIFLKGNKDVRCEDAEPKYLTKRYTAVRDDQVRRLKKKEIGKYMKERMEAGIRDV